jgi:hypothetical protein
MLRRMLPCLGLMLLAGCAGMEDIGNYAPSRSSGRCDTSFTVTNASSSTMEQFYFNPASRSDWGNDRLGEGVLEPGRSRSYRAAQSGGYDFRAVWANGRSTDLRNVDVCRASTITLTNSGLRAR